MNWALCHKLVYEEHRSASEFRVKIVQGYGLLTLTQRLDDECEEDETEEDHVELLEA